MLRLHILRLQEELEEKVSLIFNIQKIMTRSMRTPIDVNPKGTLAVMVEKDNKILNKASTASEFGMVTLTGR